MREDRRIPMLGELHERPDMVEMAMRKQEQFRRGAFRDQPVTTAVGRVE